MFSSKQGVQASALYFLACLVISQMASKCFQSYSASSSAAAAPPEGADDHAVPSSAPPGDAADYDSSDDGDYVYLPKGRDYILGREDANDEEFELDALEPSAFEWRAEDNVPKRFAFSACSRDLPQGLTVDECLWRFRRDGEVFGVKAYRLCVRDGTAPGYTSALEIYAGESEGDIPAPGRVVVDLMAAAGLFEKGYELFTDSWYTSPALFRFLQGRQTNAVGTVRSHRKHMPTDLKKTRDEVVLRSTPTGILCLRWFRDSRVTMLSTVHDAEIVDDPSKPGLTVPKVVSDSRPAMRRARQHDPMNPPTPAVPEAISWYKRVLFYLLQVAAANAFFVHGALGGKMTRYCFNRQLVVELIRGSTGKEPQASASAPPAGHRREPLV
ncbi:uncharacterized protein LOC125034291 [Penaeus chinensis]|uniref:uncharacterized protein LOC125034291 n=1 Tax=Penaeus chinensis TaxID=139456 RepID=UPI001FB73080|nr:uncharacterized protein LOC125034291 [Penaeus chinensis]